MVRAMKASPRQQHLLIELQELDNLIVRLRHKRTQLPERARLDGLHDEYVGAKEAFMAVQRELDAQQADIARLENDVETVRARRHRDNELLAHSTSPKEATALQGELDTLAKRQQDLEDRELELMELNEQTQARFDAAAQALATVDTLRDTLNRSLAESELQIDAEIAEASTERSGLAAELQRDLLDHYEKLRERIGFGAARLRGKVSEASNMELAPAELSDILSTAADEVVFCPQTGAILVREFSAE